MDGVIKDFFVDHYEEEIFENGISVQGYDSAFDGYFMIN